MNSYIFTMFTKSAGQVIVAFKPEAQKSDLEEVLGPYRHRKILDLKFDLTATRENQVLALTYLLKVPLEEESSVVKELKTNYSAVIEYAYQPSIRNMF